MLAFLALKAVLGRPLMLQHEVETRILATVGTRKKRDLMMKSVP